MKDRAEEKRACLLAVEYKRIFITQTRVDRQNMSRLGVLDVTDRVSIEAFVLGIRRGLVITMPGSQAWVRRFESPLDP